MPDTDERRTVLIIGCDHHPLCLFHWVASCWILWTCFSCSPGGIGYSLCCAFKAKGLRVFATARRLEDLAGLKAKGIETLALTVDDAQSVLQCYAEIERRVGSRGLDYLVNNAYVDTRELLICCCHSRLTVPNCSGRSESTDYQKCLGTLSSIWLISCLQTIRSLQWRLTCREPGRFLRRTSSPTYWCVKHFYRCSWEPRGQLCKLDQYLG